MHRLHTLLAGVVLLACAASALNCQVPNAQKVDCGHVGTDQQQCEASGCCWVPEGSGSSTPWCFYAATGPSPPPPPPTPSPPSPPTPPTPPPPPPGAAPFSDDEFATMLGYFMANVDIQGSGMVVASPDQNTPGGSYYFHWARDGALTMRTVLMDYNGTDLNTKMQHYVNWVTRMHAEPDPNGVDIRVDAKFVIPTGEPFSGGWCRPQTDGPGLRTITFVDYAFYLLANGQASYVAANLFNPSGDNGVIKVDLDWLMANWQSNGCDLWEEIHSSDLFWNRFTMRRALYRASALASKLGDTASAAAYNATAQAIEATLGAHYNGQFVFEDVNRQMDGAVICAFNNGYNDDGLFAPTSKEVAGTILAYNQMFHGQYDINTADDNAGIPGILYGRYEGDHYAGGNPWILTTAALAQLYYRSATEVLEHDMLPSEEALSLWGKVLNATFVGTRLGASALKASLAQALASAGDGVLLRIRYHTIGAGLHMSEQLDRETGAEESATDLTWSYSSVLRAVVQRKQLAQWAAKRGVALL